MFKVSIALIHNNNSIRNDLIKPALLLLSSYLSDYYSTNYFEILFQVDVKPVSSDFFSWRRSLFYQVALEWLQHTERPLTLSPFNQPITDSNLRSAAIELILTDKHMRAWDYFLESSDDFLICFEDDCTFNDNSLDRVGKLLSHCTSLCNDDGLYADLAGGFSIDALGVGKLISHLSNDFLYFKRPVTNTACAYLINRKFANDCKNILISHPNYRLLPADWLINKFFIELSRSSGQVTCFHSFPPIFTHGSIAAKQSTVR